MNRKRIILASVAIILIFGLIACASFTRDAYRTLTVSQQTYDTTLSVMGDLYREGKITDKQKNQGIEIGRAYKLAHNEAVASLTLYEEKGGQANKDAYIAASARAAGALAKLLAYCRPLIEKGVK